MNVSDPANPFEVGVSDYIGYAYSVTVSNDHAYVLNGFGAFLIFDVSNPSNPLELGTCYLSASGSYTSVAASGVYAFATSNYDAFYVLDCSDPSTPDSTLTLDTRGEPSDVFVSGDYAFIADGSAGLYILDVYDPENPTQAGFYDTEGNARAVCVINNYAYVADYDYFGIYDCDAAMSVSSKANPNTAEAVELSPVFPNPFNSSTTIRFNLPAPSWISLVIFDVNGREMARLIEGQYSTGTHQVVFDASACDSRIYFYSIRTKDGVITKKMVVSR